MPLIKLNKWRHRLNPLHIYCRLVDFGMSRRVAKTLCSVYDRIYKRFVPLIILLLFQGCVTCICPPEDLIVIITDPYTGEMEPTYVEKGCLDLGEEGGVYTLERWDELVEEYLSGGSINLK